MSRVAWFGLFILAATPAGNAQAPKDKSIKAPLWSIVGLRVSGQEFREGTAITAVLQVDEHFLVGIDQPKCRISISDDKGTDLLETPVEYSRFIVQEPKISHDGRYCGMEFHAPGHPAKSAAKVRIKGAVSVLIGKDEKQIEKKGTSLQEPLDLGFGVLKTSRAGSGVLTFEGSRPVKRFVVVTADGTEFEYRTTLSASRTPREAGEPFRMTLHPKSGKRVSLPDARFRVTYFDTVERFTAPIDLETGLGF